MPTTILKTMKKRNLEAYNSQIKSNRHKELLFCQALAGSTDNFEFFLKSSDDNITANSGTGKSSLILFELPCLVLHHVVVYLVVTFGQSN